MKRLIDEIISDVLAVLFLAAFVVGAIYALARTGEFNQ